MIEDEEEEPESEGEDGDVSMKQESGVGGKKMNAKKEAKKKLDDKVSFSICCHPFGSFRTPRART